MKDIINMGLAYLDVADWDGLSDVTTAGDTHADGYNKGQRAAFRQCAAGIFREVTSRVGIYEPISEPTSAELLSIARKLTEKAVEMEMDGEVGYQIDKDVIEAKHPSGEGEEDRRESER